jgi:outer membrane protein assembly factor BamB
MTYRDDARTPLVMASKKLVIALEPETGHERWRRGLEQAASRLFLASSRLFVTYADKIACLDYATGAVIGIVTVGFAVSAGFVRGERLFVAGSGGAACLAMNGTILWRVEAKSAQTLAGIRVGDVDDLTAFDAAGNVLWTAVVEGDDERRMNVGLLLDAFVAQPDL